MSGETAKPRLLLIAEQLQRHGVEFVVIGGQAAVLYGSPLPTYDIDLCYRRSPENLQRLAEALAEIRCVVHRPICLSGWMLRALPWVQTLPSTRISDRLT